MMDDILPSVEEKEERSSQNAQLSSIDLFF